ncbi:MAG: MOSC domain-containing protein [Chloroflexi bacterium]|nr:MOSC domain-containing protein [Chloroflexota bacterium]
MRTLDEMQVGLDHIRLSPSDAGRIELICRRPVVGQREVLPEAALDVDLGMIGDVWLTRGSARMADGSSDREAQLTLMNSRVAGLLAGDPAGWGIAGDQLYVDLDLSTANLPPGTRLRVGTAVVEVSAVPHTGCSQFSHRFGLDALKFVSTPEGKGLRLRGVNTRITASGLVRTGDTVSKV